jgi:hypothetical protein
LVVKIMVCYNMFEKCGGDCIKILSCQRERESRESVPVELRGNQRVFHLVSRANQRPFSSFSSVIVNLPPFENDNVALPLGAPDTV